MSETIAQAACPSCGRMVDKKSLQRNEPCQVCGERVCDDCLRRKQLLPPNWELPAGTFAYRCKRHVGALLGIGWHKVKKQ